MQIRGEKSMAHETLIQSIVSTSYGAMGLYLGLGVVILALGWVADAIVGTSKPQ
jgi:hypothetical protein